MGMFDTVNVPCPKCGTRIEIQSKAGDRYLAEFTIETVPLAILADIAGRTIYCQSCGNAFELVVQTSLALKVVSE